MHCIYRVNLSQRNPLPSPWPATSTRIFCQTHLSCPLCHTLQRLCHLWGWWRRRIVEAFLQPLDTMVTWMHWSFLRTGRLSRVEAHMRWWNCEPWKEASIFIMTWVFVPFQVLVEHLQKSHFCVWMKTFLLRERRMFLFLWPYFYSSKTIPSRTLKWEVKENSWRLMKKWEQ